MRWRITGSIVCCVAAVNFAAPDSSMSARKHLTPSAWAWTTVGQIVKGVYHGLEFVPTINFDHQWDEQLGVGLRLDATVADRFRARAGVEIASYIPFVDPKQNLINPPLRQRIHNVYIDEGYGAYRLGDPGNPFLEVTAGYFTYKYNPQVRNLGEYLFRTGTAPGYIMNFFDWPQSRLAGIRAAASIGRFRGDALLTNETDYPVPPANDFSLTCIGSYDIGAILSVGAGAQFKNLISVNDHYTTPTDTMTNQYFPAGPTFDPLSNDPLAPRKFYSFRGAKYMGRLCFDPKALFASGIFGAEDLKVYSEAVYLGFGPLGLDGYTLYFRKSPPTDTAAAQRDPSDTALEWRTIPWWQKVPVMVGFNIPAFKALDVLSFEIEWYGSRLGSEKDIYWLVNYGSPRDAMYGGSYQTYNYGDWAADDIKWSVYAKRQLWGSFSAIGQIARDHLYIYSVRQGPYYQVIQKQDHWHWNIKLLCEL